MSEDREFLGDGQSAAWHTWLLAARIWTAHLDRVLGTEADLTLVDFELLDGLAASTEPRRMCDLGTSVALTRSGATRAVTRLEKLGLVHRLPSSCDRRSIVVELTAQGRELHQQVGAVVEQEVRTNFVDVLGPDGVTQAGTAAERVRSALLRTPACRAQAREDAASL